MMIDPDFDATLALPVCDALGTAAPFLRPIAVAPYAFVIAPQAAPRERWEARGDTWYRCELPEGVDGVDDPHWTATTARAGDSPTRIALVALYSAWSALYARTQDAAVDDGWHQAAFIWMNNAFGALTYAAQGGMSGSLSDEEQKLSQEYRERARRMMLRARYRV